ncbi:ATP-dependent Clp protease proteolytic subunit 5, chloroplastic [Linum grandiflorum]
MSMAHSSVSSSAGLGSLLFSPNPISSPNPRNLALPFRPLTSSRKLSKSDKISLRTAAYSTSQLPDTSSRRGLWSIRDDLAIPSSPYFPTLASGAEARGGVSSDFRGVIDQLFQYRIIRCGGPVEDDMANTVVAQLLYLDAVDPHKDIVMYVNSPGGSVTAGMAIFDTMKHIRPDVSTICVGLAASMGAFLLSAGTKGKRYSLPNSRMMIHQPIGGTSGSQTDFANQVNEMLHHKKNLSSYLAYQTGQSYQKVNDDTELDYFMGAEEAKEYGLIDEVIVSPHRIALTT